jgi:hypothetical protein
MKYRTIGTDPKTSREVSVLSLGTMHFGTATDEATSFAILDRYAEAGGTFIDTADNYAFWAGTQGGESEELLGRWRCLLGSAAGREPGRCRPGADRGAAREAGRGPVTGAPGARTSRAGQSRYMAVGTGSAKAGPFGR